MKKLTATQMIAFIFSTISILVEAFASNPELFGIGTKGIASIVTITSLVKLMYDNYVRFQAQDVADFSNQNTPILSKGQGASITTKKDVKNWASNK